MVELRENHDFGSFMVIWPENSGTEENDDFGSFKAQMGRNRLYKAQIGYIRFK